MCIVVLAAAVHTTFDFTFLKKREIFHFMPVDKFTMWIFEAQQIFAFDSFKKANANIYKEIFFSSRKVFNVITLDLMGIIFCVDSCHKKIFYASHFHQNVIKIYGNYLIISCLNMKMKS